MNTQPMHFDSIDLTEVEVVVAGKQYVIQEADSKVGELHRSKKAQCAKGRMTDGEMSGMDIEGVGAVEPHLVSLCLKEVAPDGGRKDVPLLVIQGNGRDKRGWPDHIVKAIFDRIREISPSLDDSPTKESIAKQRAMLDRHEAKLDGKAAEAAKN